MPSLRNHHGASIIKMLVTGNTGTGKTGSLTSLVKAGYKLRILDLDNGLDPLCAFVQKECPDKIDNVHYISVRDAYSLGFDSYRVEVPKAFASVSRLLDNWKDEEIDLGAPKDWGPDTILVIDSLTKLGMLALAWANVILTAQKKATAQTAYEKASPPDFRRVSALAQSKVAGILDKLTDEKFRTNVIICTHIWRPGEEDRKKGIDKYYPMATGAALPQQIPVFFNLWVQCENANGQRTIKTIPSGTTDLKNPKPFELAPIYGIADGMAEIFAALRGQSAKDKSNPATQGK